MAQADWAGAGVRLLPERERAAAEHLRPRRQLDVDLHADHGLVLARSAALTAAPPRTRSPARARTPPRASGPRRKRGPRLEPYGQAVREPTGNRDRRDPGQRHRHREVVGQVHGKRIGGALAEPECDRRGGRRDHQVHRCKGRVEILGDARADLLRRAVVGLVVPGRERVGADHDPALDLVAEAVVASLLVHRREVRARRARPEAHAVVARQVRARLRRRDHVVGGDAVPGVRQLDLLDLPRPAPRPARAPARTRPPRRRRALLSRGPRPRSAKARRGAPCWAGRGPVDTERGRVAGVAPDERAEEERRVRHVSGEGPHWSSDEAKAIMP